MNLVGHIAIIKWQDGLILHDDMAVAEGTTYNVNKSANYPQPQVATSDMVPVNKCPLVMECQSKSADTDEIIS